MSNDGTASRLNPDDTFESEVRQQLEKILVSPMFINSARLCRFLRFAVDNAIDERRDELKEAVIGREVFDRGPDFDPRLDSIVRVEAQRLRRKLREFYESEPDSKVLIAFRAGSYVPIFRRPDNGVPARLTQGPVLSPTEADRLTIGVLPFANLSPQRDIEYFCDGLTEELINALGKQAELRVIARTTMFTFKNVAFDVRELGTRLGAGSVVEGSVRAYDDSIRIMASLVDSKTGRAVWSARYDRKSGDLLRLQDEISRSITDALRLRFADRETSTGSSVESHAHELHLRGRYAWYLGDENGVRESMELFRHAIQLYPDFAPPYVSLADSYCHLAIWGRLEPRQAFPEAKSLALEALRLDPKLSSALSTLARVMFFGDRDTSRAIELLETALELHPGSDTAMGLLGWCQLAERRPDAGIRSLLTASEMDPLSVIAKRGVGGGYYFLRQYDKAEGVLRSAVDLNSKDVDSRFLLAQVLIMQGRYEEALAEAKRAEHPDHPLSLGLLGQTHALVEETLEAHKFLERLRKLAEQTHVDPLSFALVFLGLGAKESARRWFQFALDSQSPFATLLKLAPEHDLIRDIV